ncbi:uncharacterized protein EDB93DRAFT_1250211 [Suillus bovinus]|uniref:uncharacterized protein n=1 Tax=Suillus bovinus TaxID=48563 RepID=UPI001B86AE28|nr:uncharacterized protein EDB93DRAFT_1250211 [Suillus bovinus]KAG2148153.1 hypothetical protein EDB93DRAFT_1250211 [Suillus bovinus]
MVKDSSQYSPVDVVDNDNEFDDAEWFGAGHRPKLHTIVRVWPMLSHGALICTSILFFALWMGTPSPHLRDDIAIYSPANGAVEPMVVKFNGTIGWPSIYRGPPSPEIDAAWNRIAHDVLPTRMSLEEILKAGEVDSPSKVKYPEEFGGGFMVSMEAPHQLHCLNLLRKASWPEYYEATDVLFQDTPEVVRMHLDYCIEMLRQNMMCNADVTVITWDWVRGQKYPLPNFNTRHQCRNYEKILDWAVEHAVHIPKEAMTRFEDTIDIPLPFHLTHNDV